MNTASDDLHAQLTALYVHLRDRMRTDFDRDLPMLELLVDRWERARNLGWGDGSSIHASSHVYGKVVVGSRCWIGPFTILDGTGGGLSIGDESDISAGAQIYTHDTVLRAVSGGVSPITNKPVRIGARCHIGAGAVILPGVTIGDGSVIGAGAVVTKNVEAGSVMVGVPARRSGRVAIADDGSARIERLESAGSPMSRDDDS